MTQLKLYVPSCQSNGCVLRPLPLVFWFVPYKGHGAKSTPMGVGYYKVFFSQLYLIFFPLLRNEKCRMGHEGSCGLNEWRSCGKMRRQPKYVTTTKNVFHLWVSRHNLWNSDPYFIIYVLSLLYRKVRTFQKNLVQLKQWLMHMLGYHIYTRLSKDSRRNYWFMYCPVA